jgi:hypothetical protein
MKKKLIEALQAGDRAISEDSNITNKSLVIGILVLDRFLQRFKNRELEVTLIYYGENPLTFLMLFITAYLFGYKVIKVMSKEQLEDKVLLSSNPVTFVDKGNLSQEITTLARFKQFSLFLTHNLDFILKLTSPRFGDEIEYLRSRQTAYKDRNHEDLIKKMEILATNRRFPSTPIIVEFPTSGIHSPVKYIGFGRENIHSIVRVISHLPGLMAHSAIRIFSSIGSSFFYMLSVYLNKKKLLINVTHRNNLSIELYTRRQATVLNSVQIMWMWNIMLKDFVYSNRYIIFNRRFTRWIIGLKIRKELRSFFGHSLRSLYIINADLPHEVKQLLRSSFLKVVFLYGIRETGNIIGSNTKKDRIFKRRIWKFNITVPMSLDSYKVENIQDDIHIVEDSVSGVLFVQGNAVSDLIPREIISNTVQEEDIFVNTNDVGSINKGIITFLSPIGTATSNNDHLNFDLYFAERSLLWLPEVLHTVSFEYQDNWYIGVQVDEAYLDRTNVSIPDIQKKLNDIRRHMNLYLPPSNVIRGIDVTTNDLILNDEGKPVRFLHRMGEETL